MLAAFVAAAVFAALPAHQSPLVRLMSAAEPVYCGGTRGGAFALTFDDGPSPYTPALVRVLRHVHARATFFDVGSRVLIWPAAARASSRVGDVENHTWSHPHLSSLRARDAAREILRTQRAVERVVGHTPRLFRPPYAEAQPADERLARTIGLVDVRWSVDGGDARLDARARRVARTSIAGLRSGAIVLLHDAHPWTAVVARRILRVALRRGLRPVTVEELLTHQPPSARQRASTGTARCPPP